MTDHRSHNHPNTSAARAICRRKGPAAAAAHFGGDASSTAAPKKAKGAPTLDDRIRANKKRPKPGPVKTYTLSPEEIANLGKRKIARNI